MYTGVPVHSDAAPQLCRKVLAFPVSPTELFPQQPASEAFPLMSGALYPRRYSRLLHPPQTESESLVGKLLLLFLFPSNFSMFIIINQRILRGGRPVHPHTYLYQKTWKKLFMLFLFFSGTLMLGCMCPKLPKSKGKKKKLTLPIVTILRKEETGVEKAGHLCCFCGAKQTNKRFLK